MNDKQQLASMGDELRLTEEQAKRLAGLDEMMPRTGVLQVLDDEPLCMAKRIEELEAQVENLTNRLVWRNTGSPNGLRRFMTQKQYDKQTPGIQKWYEPIRYEVPEGWQLVPMGLTEEMVIAAVSKDPGLFRHQAEDLWSVLLAAAPKLDSTK